jgi:hypothetical protein
VFVVLIPVATSVPVVGRFATVMVPASLNHGISKATVTANAKGLTECESFTA